MKNSSRQRGLSMVELLASLAICGVTIGGVAAVMGGTTQAQVQQASASQQRATLRTVTTGLRAQHEGWQLAAVQGGGHTATLIWIDPAPRPAAGGELEGVLEDGSLTIQGAGAEVEVAVPGSECSPVTHYAARVITLNHVGSALREVHNLGREDTPVARGVTGMRAEIREAQLNLALQAADVRGERAQTVSDVYAIRPLVAPACPAVVRNAHAGGPTTSITQRTAQFEPRTPGASEPAEGREMGWYADRDGNVISERDWEALAPGERYITEHPGQTPEPADGWSGGRGQHWTAP